jgi:voltage-gated potassium channel
MAEHESTERILGLRPRAFRRLMRSVQSGRIVPYLAGITAVAACLMALVMRLVDSSAFPSYGRALWFSIVTLMTVGYGDVVPDSGVGRLFASVLMIFGVTLIAFVTAVVTSALVIAEQRRVESALESDLEPEVDVLARIERRLEAIEKKLSG